MSIPDRLDLLETFLRVSEAGALSRAAVLLGVSQPSVSRRMKTLEELVGAKLLHRTTHYLSLTDEGRRLLPIAHEIVGKWDAGLDLLRDIEPQGLLRVAAPVGLGQERLVDEVACFLARHPAVRIDWMLTDEPVDLFAGEADVWIRVGGVSDERLVVRKLMQVQRFLVATPGLAEGSEDWTKLPFVALSPFYGATLELFDRKGRPHPQDINVVMASDNILAVKRGAMKGIGVALLPDWLTVSERERGELARIAPRFSGRPLDVVVAYAPERGRPLRLTKFIQFLMENIRSDGT